MIKKYSRIKVVKGVGRGKKIGVPTINLDTKSISGLGFGIYVCRVDFRNGNNFWGVMHFGARPTFGEKELTLEATLFDFDKNFKVPAELDLAVFDFIRPVKKFSDVDSMLLEIEKDIGFAKERMHKYLENT